MATVGARLDDSSSHPRRHERDAANPPTGAPGATFRIQGAANGIFFNHGQCCNARSRLYIQSKAYDDVVAGVADIAKGIKVAPGTDPESQIGPLISDEQFQKVLG